MTQKRFALLGAAGFVAPRHMRAIHDTGHALVAACDPYDGVGVIDRWAPEARFFTEVERFDRHLEKLRRAGEGVDFVSVCTPNYLHDAHCRLAMRVGADVICEKPLVTSPWNLDQLAQIETETGQRVYTVLQLRHHEAVRELKSSLLARGPLEKRLKVRLDYVTRRGAWYHQSWKGNLEKSGGVAMNIGIHFFDLLLWLFGSCSGFSVAASRSWARGTLSLENADVAWNLSVDAADLPEGCVSHAHRSLTIEGEPPFDFSTGFDDLHTRVYESMLAGHGYGIEAARPAVELAHRIRRTLEDD